jgi:diguanylate cyclase (GGDEF)-like protein
MAPSSDASRDAEKTKQQKRRKKGKQTASAADARVRGSELREANEHLILAALQAETMAEKAVTHLDELAHSSKHDDLTGTPNRALMLDRLENAIAFAKRHGTRVGVLFVDLDEFKQINDTFGHSVGDAAVQLAARRIEAQVRQSDTISRHGGDEFLVLLAEVTQPTDAALVAEKILAALAAPGRIEGHQISLSASIGIALFPDDATDAATLILNADSAMYHSKKDGGGIFQFHGTRQISALRQPSAPEATCEESPTAQRSHAKKTLRETNEQLVLSALAARKLAEQTRQKHARQVNFMAMVAHELRNALMPIKTATGLLDSARTADLMDDAHDLLGRQVAHMSRLIDDLLISARIGTGNFRLAISSVDVLDVLTRALDTSRSALETKHQQLTQHLPPGPVIVQADAMRLAQVFTNLLHNASKYTPDGGEICVTGELAEDAVVITVSDNGIGIAPDRLDSIFELFAQGECGSVDSGAGIGLAVVRDLVEAHGGSVVARSRGENLGSEFAVTLPMRPADGATLNVR